jgi:TonB family protein
MPRARPQRNSKLQKYFMRILQLLVVSLGLVLLIAQDAVCASRMAVNAHAAHAFAGWQRFGPLDEEFSVLLPVPPTVLTNSGNKEFIKGGEPVERSRYFSGNAEGFIFVIESYKVLRPRRLILEMAGEFRLLGPALDIVAGGINGTRRESFIPGLSAQVYTFVTDHHVYVVRLATQDARNPGPANLISSLTFGNNDGLSFLALRETDELDKSPAAGAVLTRKQVDRRPIVFWQAQPSYTERARAKQTAGTVRLNLILTDTGKVLVLGTVGKLGDGLTEQGIEAAKNIKFFPALKSGKPVSMYFTVEFEFSLY